MEKIITFFEGVINELSDEYCDDYMDESIPYSRVCTDRERCVKMIEDYFAEEKGNSQRELVLALYGNFYIKYGMAGRFELENDEDENDGLSSIFGGLSPVDSYLRDVYMNVKTQNDDAWDEILEINKGSVVAKIYKFVKLCHSYCVEISEKGGLCDVNKYEKMWELYETIPHPWDKYVIGEGEYIRESANFAWDPNLLPYVRFISLKEILMNIIQDEYGRILEKLEIEKSTKPADIYGEVLDELGITRIEDFWMEIMVSRLNMNPNEWNTAVLTECLEDGLDIWMDSRRKFKDVNWDMTVLFEKMHWCLIAKEDKEWMDENIREYSFSEMYPALRTSYLHIPVRGPIKYDVFEAQQKEYRANRRLKRIEKQKAEMMDYYAHSWKHISYPQIVKEVAEELSASNQTMANRLMKAYNSELTLQRGIQLMQYISSGDDCRVNTEFKKGIASSDLGDGKMSLLENVLADSLDLVIFKILMVESDDSSSIEKCREKWEHKKSLSDLQKEYTENFLEAGQNSTDIVSWVNDNLLQINVCIEKEWKDVKFKKNSFAESQFKEILVEIFTNAFLHGDEYIAINFNSNDDHMFIIAENPCNNNVTGSRSGISTLERVLDYINRERGWECEKEPTCKSVDVMLADKYEITIRFNKNIFVKRRIIG